MNTLILFESDRLKDSTFEVRDRKRLEHLEKVLKVEVGQSLKVGLLGDRFGTAKILGFNPLQLDVEWHEKKSQDQCEIKLSIGLSRPPTLKKILEHATSLGVSSFEFYRAKLSEKSYADSKIFDPHTMNELLIAGLSQASHSLVIPKVTVSKSGVSQILPVEQSFILSLGGDKSFCDYQIDYTRPLHFVLGPERGLTLKEERTLIEKGLRPIKIHQSILRVEIATFALLGAIEVLRTNDLK